MAFCQAIDAVPISANDRLPVLYTHVEELPAVPYGMGVSAQRACIIIRITTASVTDNAELANGA